MSCFQCSHLDVYIGKKVKVRLGCSEYSKHLNQNYSYEIGTIVCLSSEKIHVQFSCQIYGYPTCKRFNPFVYEITLNDVFILDYVENNHLWNINQVFKCLEFGKINRIDLNDDNIISYSIHTFDGINEKNTIYNTDNCKNPNTIDVVYMNNNYSYYRGYANINNFNEKNSENQNPNYQNVDRAYIDFINHLGMWILDKDSPPPEVGQLVCGIVKDSKYAYWFASSDQFYTLWILLVYGESHNMFVGRNKKQILDLLETSPYRKVVGSNQEKIKNYKFNNVEPSAKLYSDIYKSIAKVFYYNEDIPITYLIPSSRNHITGKEDESREKSYKDYLLYVFG